MSRSLLLLILISVPSALARTLSVPRDYPTIQAALNAISDGDSIVVDAGTYEEALIAPPHSFTLFGMVAQDSTSPVLDPSGLPNPQQQRCLLLTDSECRIENFVFRNGAAMHPHQDNFVGGIECNSANASLRRCTFDSVHVGIRAANGDSIVLNECVFASAYKHAVRCLAPMKLVASDCSFEGDSVDWAMVDAAAGSRLVGCSLSGSSPAAHLLMLAGENLLIRRCLFGPASSPLVTTVYLSSPSVLVDSNLFVSCPSQSGVVSANCPCAGHVTFSDNEFRDIVAPPDWDLGRSSCASLFHLDTLDNPCRGSVVVRNTFVRGTGFAIVKGVAFRAIPTLERNQFYDMLPDSVSCVFAGSTGARLRQNIFQHNGSAVEGEPLREVDAEYNYWGDSTGPYHPTLNPNGLGDEVGDFVDFDPWYTDTLFWNSSSPEPRPQLPNEVSLSVYPNPFNATTTLELFVPKAQIVEVKLYDLLGREAKVLFKGPAVDVKRISVDAHDLASGIYFARASDPIRRRSLAEVKMLLVR